MVQVLDRRTPGDEDAVEAQMCIAHDVLILVSVSPKFVLVGTMDCS